MTRPVGTRDKQYLYGKIIRLLKKNPEGLYSAQISSSLKENDATIRNYLHDMVKDNQVISTPVTKRITRYSLPKKNENARHAKLESKTN